MGQVLRWNKYTGQMEWADDGSDNWTPPAGNLPRAGANPPKAPKAKAKPKPTKPDKPTTQKPDKPSKPSKPSNKASAAKAARVQAKADKQFARQKRIALARAKTDKAALRRTKKIAARVARQKEIAEAKIAENAKKIEVLQQQIASDVRAGNDVAAQAKSRTIEALENTNSAHRRGLIGEKNALARANANAELQRIAAEKSDKDTPRGGKRRKKEIAALRDTAMRPSLKVDKSLRDAYNSKLEPGDVGRGREIQRAMNTEILLQQRHPEFYNESTMLWLGNQLTLHQNVVQRRYNRVAKEGEKLVDIREDKSKSLAERQRANTKIALLLDKPSVQNLMAQHQLLYGKTGKTNIKGTKIPKGKSGLLWDYYLGSEKVYETQVQRQNDIMFGTGLDAEARKLEYEQEAQALWDEAEETKHVIFDTVREKDRMQTTDERATEIIAAAGGADEMLAKARGAKSVVDAAAKYLKYKDNPILGYLWKEIASVNIQSNKEFTGAFKEELIEDVIPKAQEAAMAAWKESDDFIPNYGAESGVYDHGQYYRDADGEHFILPNGDVVSPGEPMPPQYAGIVPLWNHLPDQSTNVIDRIASGNPMLPWDVDSGDLAEQQENAQYLYEKRHEQHIENVMRFELGVDDPGFLGDVFRTNIAGELVGLFDAIPGAAAYALRQATERDHGISLGQIANGYGEWETDSMFVREDMFEGWKTFSIDSREGTGDALLDFVAPLFPVRKTVGFPADMVSTRINPETGEEETYIDGDEVAMEMMIGVPTIGPVSFTSHASNDIRKAIAEERISMDQAIENGDWLLSARVLGRNEPFQFGNMAGALNFVWFMMLDPTNFLPAMTIAKKGLRAVKVAARAGRLPNEGQDLGRWARVAVGFVEGAREDIKAAEKLTGMATDVAKAFDTSPRHVQEGLATILANVRSKPGRLGTRTSRITEFTEGLIVYFGLQADQVDMKSLRALATKHVDTAMDNADWIVYTQADEAAAIFDRAARIADGAVGERQYMRHAIELRNRATVDEMERIAKSFRGELAAKRAALVKKNVDALKISRTLTDKQIDKAIARLTKAGTDPERLSVLRAAKKLRADRTNVARQTIEGDPGHLMEQVAQETDELLGEKRIARGAKKLKGADRDRELRHASTQLAAKKRVAREEQMRRIKSRIASEQRRKVFSDRMTRPDGVVQGGINALTSLKKSRAGQLLYRGAPQAWKEKADFWTKAISEGFTNTKMRLDAVFNEVTQQLDAVSARYGVWDDSVPLRTQSIDRSILERAAKGDADTRVLWVEYVRSMGVKGRLTKDGMSHIVPNSRYPNGGTVPLSDHNIIDYDTFSKMVESLKKKSYAEGQKVAKAEAAKAPKAPKTRAETPNYGVKRIISGGQTGGDRGGLDAGHALGIETGGTAPKGYKTATGSDESLKALGLSEDASSNYVPRTMKNVDDADATIAYSLQRSAGTDKTIVYAQTGKWPSGRVTKAPQTMASGGHKPVLVIDAADVKKGPDFVAQKIRNFLDETGAESLNIAGHRETSVKKFSLHDFVDESLQKALKVKEEFPDELANDAVGDAGEGVTFADELAGGGPKPAGKAASQQGLPTPEGFRTAAEQKLVDDYESLLRQSFENALAKGKIKPLNDYEGALHMTARQQFAGEFTNTWRAGREASAYLDNIASQGDAGKYAIAKEAVYGLLEDEINTFNVLLANTVVDVSRPDDVNRLLSSSMGKIARRFEDESSAAVRAIYNKGYDMTPAREGAIIGYEGRRMTQTLDDFDKVMTSSIPVSAAAEARVIDDVARHLVYGQMTAQDYRLASDVARRLASAGNRSKAGRTARLLRERIQKEMDTLGYDPAYIRPPRKDYQTLGDVAEGMTREYRGIPGRSGVGPGVVIQDGGGRFGDGIYTAPSLSYTYRYAYDFANDAVPGTIAAIEFPTNSIMHLESIGEYDIAYDVALKMIRDGQGKLSGQDQANIGTVIRNVIDDMNAEKLVDPDYGGLIEWDKLSMLEFFKKTSSNNQGVAVGAAALERALTKNKMAGFAYDTLDWYDFTHTQEAATLIKDKSVLRLVNVSVETSSSIAGPTNAQRATVQAGAIFNEMGMSEVDWLKSRLKRNKARINNKKTDPLERTRLLEDNKKMDRAIEDIAREKAGDKYTIPRMQLQQSLDAAETVRMDVAGILPTKVFAYYGETAEQMRVEVARGIHQTLYEAPIVQAEARYAKEIENFDMALLDPLNEEVGTAVKAVQGERRSSVGIKFVGQEADETEESWDDILKSVSDRDPVILKAKEDALQAHAAANGYEALSVEAYDRMRTLVEPHRGRARRGEALMNEARAQGGDYTETYLALRQAAADANAVDNIAWTLMSNPGMTVDEALRDFTLSWFQDGTIRRQKQSLNLTDQSILKRYFKVVSGADADDPIQVKAALSAEDTKPPMDNKLDFSAEQQRRGEWSPRSKEQAVAGKAYNIVDEREWFMAHYGEAPAWTTDPRLVKTGEAFETQAMYQTTMKETGNYNEQLRIQRALGETRADAETMIYGDADLGLKPMKDIASERKWVVERYGDLVGKIDKDGNVNLVSMPWLMNKEELIEYAGRHGGKVPGLYDSVDEIVAVDAALQRAAEKHVNAMRAAVTVPDGSYLMTDSTTTSRIAFDMTQEVAHAITHKGFRKFTNRNMIDLWSKLWAATVVSQPAFIISNVVDTVTKGIWFSISNPWTQRATKESIEDIKSMRSLGIEGTAYFDPPPMGHRGFRTRMSRKTSYGNMDRLGAGFDLIAFAPSRKILQGIEHAVKLRVARQIYAGLMEDFGPMLRKGLTPKAIKSLKNSGFDDATIDLLRHGVDEDTVKLLLKLRVKQEILRLFPTLDNAGFAERLLNKFFPFISYNFNNKRLWLTEIVEHPWLIPIITQAQTGLAQYNLAEWKRNNPYGPDVAMPEHLTQQIRIGGIDSWFYFDLANFTDMARGASILLGKGTGGSVGTLIGQFIRPLPSQQALFHFGAYEMFGIGARNMWQKVFDEDGYFWGDYKMVKVPPGTPWGDKPLDILKDLVWPVAFAQNVQKAMEDGKLTHDETLRLIGNLVAFGEFGEPTDYYVLTQQYFSLPDDHDVRDAWLKTEDGQRLKDYWDQQYLEPTTTRLDPMFFAFGEKVKDPNTGEITLVIKDPPEPSDIRLRWLGLQQPEVKQLFFDGWQESRVADEAWDQIIDEAKWEERDMLWDLRRTWFAQWYHERPYLWTYGAMGMTPEEFQKHTTKMLLDNRKNAFFNAYGWEQKPEKPKKLKKWLKEREAFLEANPDVLESLEESKTFYDRAVDMVNESWDTSIRVLNKVDTLQHAAYAREDDAYLEASEAIRQFYGRAFDAEALGRDSMPDATDPNFKIRPDMLTLRLKKAAGDPEAEKEVLYAQRLQAVARKAGDDPLKWHNIMDKNQDLLELYFERNPKKRARWERDGQYLEFWHRFGRLADKGQWDEAWDSWDEAPQWLRDRYAKTNPRKAKEFEATREYVRAMGQWMALWDSKGGAAAMAFFDNLPLHIKQRYWSTHPGSAMNSGQGSAYVSTLNTVFGLIDKGDWDSAEKAWMAAPAWMRRRYYANNPSSTLFRGGKGGSGGSGGGIPDAKYKLYIKEMGKWVDLMKNGEDAAADKFFRNMPKWMQDFYLARHPDQALLKENMKMQSLLEEYFLANKASQRAMLKNNPALAKWLMQNDAKAARTNALMFLYDRLPDDPWIKRVFREKYPEVFSKEAEGEAKKQAVWKTLEENPELVAPWQRWYADIIKTLTEAQKYIKARPKQLEVDREDEKRRRHEGGKSAEETSEQIRSYVRQMQNLNKRQPNLEQGIQ